jgi:hypothetical protein
MGLTGKGGAVLLALLVVAGSTGCSSGNIDPVIALEGGHRCVQPGSEVVLLCTITDDSTESLAFSWKAETGEIISSGMRATWTVPETPGDYTVMVVVTDEKGGEAGDEMAVYVRDNHPPLVEQVTASPDSIDPAETTTITCVASDPDGDELNYTWRAERGNIIGESAQVRWVAPNTGGRYTITVEVTDSCGLVATGQVEVGVVIGPCCPT